MKKKNGTFYANVIQLATSRLIPMISFPDNRIKLNSVSVMKAVVGFYCKNQTTDSHISSSSYEMGRLAGDGWIVGKALNELEDPIATV